MKTRDPLLFLLQRFREQGVEYVKPEWFAPAPDGTVENIRVADDLLVDLLFSANGETYESVQPHVRELDIEGVLVRVLDIDGLLKTKTDYREKDVLDRKVLMRIKQDIGKNDPASR